MKDHRIGMDLVGWEIEHVLCDEGFVWRRFDIYIYNACHDSNKEDKIRVQKYR